jgi:hypothetical protein
MAGVNYFPSFSCMYKSSTVLLRWVFFTLLTHNYLELCYGGLGLGISMLMQLNRITICTSGRSETLIEFKVVTKSRSFCYKGKKRISDLRPNLYSLVTIKLLYMRRVPPNSCSLILYRIVRSLSETFVLRSSSIFKTKSFWKVTLSFYFKI